MGNKESKSESMEIDSNDMNKYINLLVFGFCHKYHKAKSQLVPVAIYKIIIGYSRMALFGFKMNKFSNSFKITDYHNSCSGKYNIQKIDHCSHNTIIFGENLKRKTFESVTCNFVFNFKILDGIVYLMFVPGDFNHFEGVISNQDMINNDYCIFKLRAGYNYQYGQQICVEIDFENSIANITNVTYLNQGKASKAEMNFGRIKSKKIKIAFAMMNPYAEIDIINQYWQRKPNITNNSKICYDLDYDTSDDDVDVNMKEPEIMQSKPPMNIIDTSKIPSNRVSTGLNYIGKCGDHIGVANRGFGDDIRPNEDYFEGNIICNRCSSKFKCQTMIIHDCRYQIRYSLYKKRSNDEIQTIQSIAYPNYVDVCKDILKYQEYDYLTLTVQPHMEF